MVVEDTGRLWIRLEENRNNYDKTVNLTSLPILRLIYLCRRGRGSIKDGGR